MRTGLVGKGASPAARAVKAAPDSTVLASTMIPQMPPAVLPQTPQAAPPQTTSDALEARRAPPPHDAMATKVGTRIEPASLIFDGDWYRQQYPDVAAARLDPVRHFFDNGFREGRNPNRYFDTAWYSKNNPDVAAARLNPFLHYLLYGAVEGRKPAP